MKSTRALIMIVVSLLLGSVAVWLAARWVGQQANENTSKVVVTTVNVDPGALLLPTMLRSVNWPADSMPAGSFPDIKKLEGRVSGTTLFAGEPVLEAKLAPQGATGGLSTAIQKGKRAISLQVNEIVGVAGYIRPGSLVDVMVNTREGGAGDVAISKIILEKVLVLAVAQDDKRDQTKPKVVSTVTLEVEPQEAEKIDLARNIGTLSLVLRNPLDSASAVTPGAHRNDVVAQGATRTATPTPAAAPPAPRPPGPPRASSPPASGTTSVEVIRGVQKANSVYEVAK